jgi:hypothetical protein
MEVRSAVVSVRLTPQEREKLHLEARAAGISLSEIIRSFALRAKVHARRHAISDETLRELSSWGNNLNQMTRKLNEASHNGFSSPLLEKVLQDIPAIYQAILAIAEKVR